MPRATPTPSEVLAVGAARPAGCPREVARAREQRHAADSMSQRDAAGRRHLGGVADEAEARDVGAGVHVAAAARAARSAAARFSVVIERDGRVHDARSGARPNLIAVADDAGAERLGQEQHVARPARRRWSGSAPGSTAPVTA